MGTLEDCPPPPPPPSITGSDAADLRPLLLPKTRRPLLERADNHLYTPLTTPEIARCPQFLQIVREFLRRLPEVECFECLVWIDSPLRETRLRPVAVWGCAVVVVVVVGEGVAGWIRRLLVMLPLRLSRLRLLFRVG